MKGNNLLTNWNFLHLLIFGGSWCSSSVVDGPHTRDHQKACEPSFPAGLSLVSLLGSQERWTQNVDAELIRIPVGPLIALRIGLLNPQGFSFFTQKPKTFLYWSPLGDGNIPWQKIWGQRIVLWGGSVLFCYLLWFPGILGRQACKACTLTQGTKLPDTSFSAL